MMTFEEMLASRLKGLPTKSFSEDTWNDAMQEIRRRHSVTNRDRKRRVWGSIAAVAVAIIIAAVTLHSLNLLPVGSEAARPNFAIVVSPNEMVPTPLDTTDFRSILGDYLQRHSQADSSSSSGTAVSNQDVPSAQDLPVINQVSDLAIRWSHVEAAKYGYALVTYQGNGIPRIATVLAVKAEAQTWTIAQVNNFPELSSAALSKFPVYPADWGGTGITLNDHVAFRFMSGLVIDKSITHIMISSKNGQTVNVPVINGVYGYARTDATGTAIYNGAYSIGAFDQQGRLLFKLG